MTIVHIVGIQFDVETCFLAVRSQIYRAENNIKMAFLLCG